MSVSTCLQKQNLLNISGKAEISSQDIMVNIAESPLSWLFAHKKITAKQLAAGEALRLDYERAGLSPHITMDWDRLATGRVNNSANNGEQAYQISQNQQKAKARFDEAMALLGSGLQDIAWRVICAGEAMNQAERALKWPNRSGKLVLTLALDRLARYYGV